MKIAFVVPGFAADENDWCIPAHTDIVRELARTNQVHVFSMRYPHRVDVYKIGNAAVHSFNGVGSRGIASAQLWQNVLRAMAREQERERFDVIHAIFGSEAGCVAVIAGKLFRAPGVVWLVNGEMVGLRELGYGADLIARQRWMNRLILRYADCVLCGSQQTAETARARKAKARVELLPLGVSLERFATSPSPSLSRRGATAHPPSWQERVTAPKPAPYQGGCATFVNVGSLVSVKDQATLLVAFWRVRQQLRDARLTIAGVGPLEEDLRASARELEIQECVTFAGNVPHEELAELYRNGDVFVQASRHEGQGMALLEAAACGCAVCGTNVGALRDLARANAAVACAVGDADALADAMLCAYTNRVGLRERARQQVECEYNLSTLGARLENLYKRLKQGA